VRRDTAPSSTIITDEFPAYRRVGDNFGGRHYAINDSNGQYVGREKCGDDLVSTNTAESFFGLFKCGFGGIYHKMSVKLLERYVTETAFRWNTS